VRTQFVVGLDIMFVAALGLVVRSAIGPVERLLNMLGHQHIARWPTRWPRHERGLSWRCAPLRRPRAAAATSISLVFETCCYSDRADAARPSRSGVRDGRRVHLVLRSGHCRVSKDEIHTGSWFETAQVRLLT